MKYVVAGLVLGVVVIIGGIAASAWFAMNAFSFQGSGPSPTGWAKPPPTTPPPPPFSTPGPPVPSPTPTPRPTSTAADGVKFQLDIGDVTGTGLSRTVTARISNTGGTDAHNVWLKFEVFSQNTQIKVDGRDYAQVDIGTIRARETVTRQATLSVNPFDALKIMGSGARFVLTVNSDEGSETFAYDYKP